MSDVLEPDSIEWWLADVRAFIMDAAPSLLPLFDIYSAEAIFGRRFIASDLERLQPGARIIEVGAGLLLLSCQLVREGFHVTALEPTASGFSHFEQMRRMVQQRATMLGFSPKVLDLNAENLTTHNCFDYAFSINVMEHVDNVALVFANVGRSLVIGASYRFTCPNYLFPYEPHFNIPTLFSKRLTEIVLSQKILSSRDIPDPLGLWKSLNWISVVQVHRISKKLPWIRVTFNPLLLVSTLERISSDRNFSNRRSPTMRKLLILFVGLQLHHLLRFMPAILQPVMDCRVEKISDSGVY
ncbi:bifunctional 2-polyprenyl-6-hydroxyphenol methylase/3-demethylubiquinol 3-O-methyltransferase UbiG [Polynucleobacter sp. MWH-HuK1]|uniref:class I SAM-dependent methyltransferase n=1 Tax=Polynucleobacter sp. MWH-HuK1 TaxID=1743158 RepID=UPI001C0B8357|nr:class I SAM-dependent methyltransferase [Polynucleobacter sp. MWH-HuK1]MBU3564428.1 class I SAM-dependent methyltransferase [Polynucleobacter sp. MWH-HuK1]